MNFNCLKPTGEPARLSLKEICTHFLDFRKEVIVRRLKFDLAVIEKRLHILTALVIIFNNLDKALKLIRSSKSRQEAATNLKKAFKLDDEQVSAVLEIPLYRLVSMEINKIQLEQKEKLKEQKEIKTILASQKLIWNEVKTELQEVGEKFGDKRRTKIKTIETVEYNPEDFIEHESVVLVLSRNGWLRKTKNLTDPASLKFKENDGLLGIVRTNTRDLAAIFTSAGMVYIHKVFNLPTREAALANRFSIFSNSATANGSSKYCPYLEEKTVKPMSPGNNKLLILRILLKIPRSYYLSVILEMGLRFQSPT